MTPLVLSCEHARATVPRPYAHLFAETREVLRTHRACDWGALALANHLSRALGAPLNAGEVTRLLIDLNRPLTHPKVFSELSRMLPPQEKQALARRFHVPHWGRVIAALGALAIPRIHVSVHSFTPVLNGEERVAEVGLLYDPARPLERELCRRWVRALARAAPDWRVRRNYPYRGVSQGLTTSLRAQLGPTYVGVELELNQALWEQQGKRARRVIVESLRKALGEPL